MYPAKPSTNASGALKLSPEDVQKLLSPESGVEGRVVITEKLATQYSKGSYGSNEAVIAEQIFRLLVRDTESRVRTVMAEQLKTSGILPKDIALTLAQDTEDKVALPMLKFSEALTEEDLLSLVNSVGSERHVAMSERKRVPEKLAGKLLEKSDPLVTKALVGNNGAALGEQALKNIMERYSNNEDMMRSLAERPLLPMAVSEKVLTLVSSAVAEEIRAKYKISEEAMRQAAERTHEKGTLELLRGYSTPYEIEKLVSQLHLFERLNAPMLFCALAEGNTLFFEMSLSKMANIALPNVQTLLNDRGDLGFRAVYNKCSLPASMFGAVRALLNAAQAVADSGDVKRGEDFAKRVKEQLLQVTAASPIENLDALFKITGLGFR